MKISQVAARVSDLFGAMPAARCAAMVGTAAVLAFAPAAHAVVVTSPAAGIVIPVTTAGVYINVVSGLVTTAPAANVGWDLNPWGTGSLFVYGATGGGTATTGGAVAALTVGSVVGPASTFTTSATAATAANGWVTNGTNYFGFSFMNEANGLTHYGYGTISVGAAFNTAGRAVVNLFYESVPGVAITVTAVPEPSSWALMLGGLAMAGAIARRRSQAAA